MESERPLGEFLRARRQLTTTDQVGLTRVGRRRTPGLRRDEVAMLAGVSSDYYVRLEQGRERHPSDKVLDALAEVLQLGPDATEHLHELAHPRSRKRRSAGPVDQVNPYVLRLVQSWDNVPAFVVNRRLDVLAINPLAAALHEGLEYSDNLLRMIFLNRAARELFVDWEQNAWFTVAHLRAEAGADREDPFLLELVEELSLRSADFRRMWARHEVRVRRQTSIHFHHRDVGEMTLHFEMFAINSALGQHLAVGQAEPGSASEDALALLGSLAGKGE